MDYPCRYIYGDVGCETLSDIFGVAIQAYEAILRESGDQSIDNLLIIVAGSLVITRNPFFEKEFSTLTRFHYPSRYIYSI